MTALIDIDECSEGTANCDQMCVNNDGGFECQCQIGFNEDPVSKMCIGECVCVCVCVWVGVGVGVCLCVCVLMHVHTCTCKYACLCIGYSMYKGV